MQTILLVLQVMISLGLIGLVLIQHGKGADAGAAFGSGASATVFGARGAGSFLTRTTAILAALFFANGLALAYLAGGSRDEPQGLMERMSQVQEQPAEDVPGGPPPATTTAPADVPTLDVPAVDE